MSLELLELPAFLLFAFGVSVATILFLRPHADRLGLMDLPDARKQHGEAVPLIGGVGIAFAVCITGLLLEVDARAFSAFLVATLPLFLTGLRDDQLGLSTKQRFAAQVVAALIMVFGGKVFLHDLGDLFGFGTVELGWSMAPFTVLCVVGLINAFNMADGVDGLAGSLGLVAASGFAIVAWGAGAPNELGIAVALIGALAGFLLFNFDHPRRPVRVFMGDAGSMFLGFVLVWLAISVTQRPGDRDLYPISAVWILGLPILDTISTMLRRIQIGRSPFQSDRTHLHHLLLALGFRQRGVVLIEVSIAVVLAAIGLVACRMHVPEALLTFAFLAIASAYLSLVTLGWSLAARIGTVSAIGVIDPARGPANDALALQRTGARSTRR